MSDPPISSEVEELDVEGILPFAERILPRAPDLLVQSPLDQRERFQQLFFPEGIAFDGSAFVGTAATARAFNYLPGLGTGNERVVDQIGVEPRTEPRTELRTEPRKRTFKLNTNREPRTLNPERNSDRHSPADLLSTRPHDRLDELPVRIRVAVIHQLAQPVPSIGGFVVDAGQVERPERIVRRRNHVHRFEP